MSYCTSVRICSAQFSEQQIKTKNQVFKMLFQIVQILKSKSLLEPISKVSIAPLCGYARYGEFLCVCVFFLNEGLQICFVWISLLMVIVKTLFLNIPQNSQKNTSVVSLLLIKLPASPEKTSTRVFFCEFCESFSNTFLQIISGFVKVPVSLPKLHPETQNFAKGLV